MEILKRIQLIIDQFHQKKKKIAIAESCTGGYICHMITNISGASKIFERGIICYSNQAKIELLGIEEETLKQFGAVSDIVAHRLATNIRQLSKVDIGIGITCIAGPTGGTSLKPVGLVFIGFSSTEKTLVKNFQIKASRIKIKEKILDEVLTLLEEYNQ
ncbi:MAG: CinA family protein [Candidatus Lokiarchaeota archaeon]|nr:CinA family protein [Candidatus Lokiarchaeota archaeon]